MKQIYKGKTKDVFKIDDHHVLLKFKDDVTGEDGVFDPGANTVGLTMPGAGKANVKMTTYFFKLFADKNIPTHFVSSDLEHQTMQVKNAKMLGNGLEIICRYRAVGSFLRRYGAYCQEHDELHGIIEVTIKDDVREDPPISRATLLALNILTVEEYDKLIQLTNNVSNIVKDEFSERGLELYDIKLEFGRDQETNEIMLIDEISAGNMRVYQNKKQIEPMELNKLFFEL